MILRVFFYSAFIFVGITCSPLFSQQTDREKLWAAVRAGDSKEITRLLDSGVDVNAANEIGITALWIAAGKEKPEIVQLLLDRGANVNSRDGIWYQTPLSTASRVKSDAIFESILNAGAKDVEDAARAMISMGNIERFQRLIKTGMVSQESLDGMLYSTPESKTNIIAELKKAGARAIPDASEQDKKRWTWIADEYENDNGGKLILAVEPVGLVIKSPQGNTALREASPNVFVPLGSKTSSISIERDGEKVRRIAMRRFTAESLYYPVIKTAKVQANNSVIPTTEALNSVAKAVDWQQFRGPSATGVADNQNLPIQWNVDTGENIKWKTPVPGLGHSCPVVSGGRVFLTTAISGDPDPKIRIGNYGDVASVDDTTEHTWHVLCIDQNNGEILWNRQVHKGVPKIKRHLKGSQANCTPATDGRYVVACFGAEGLYCFNAAGDLIWKRDLSTIDSSFALDEEYEWGFAGSPVIFDGLVIVQYDLSHDSFIAAYSLSDGNKVWETARDEIPSWSSPTLWKNSLRTELVTNASQFARSYDPANGKELWRLAKKSEATIPAPVPYGDQLILCSGNRPIQPIFAVRPGGQGDISLRDSESANPYISWSLMRGGPYMPTPVAYRDHLYVCSNTGVLTCYAMANGKIVYRERIGGTSYTSSPVASDGRIYFVAENGEVRVVKAGEDFQLIAQNELKDICMTVPAISGGILFIRTQHDLFALQQGARWEPSSKKTSNTDK